MKFMKPRGGSMKFELNEYHRNVSDEELIADVKRVAETLGKNTLNAKEYALHGKYSQNTMLRRFGPWRNVLELCSLETHGHNHKFVFSDEDIIADLKGVADILGVETLSAKEYSIHGKYHASTLIKYRGPWNKILELAGMKPILNRNFSNEDLFKEIERVWVKLGRQPTTDDIKKGISKYSLQSYARRFGGWRKALEAFVDFINSDDPPQEASNAVERDETAIPEVAPGCFVHKTPRDINLRLRFKVLSRDLFKCCACGATPAKDPAVELQVDHIVPWSKGGETVLDNLQTLCAKCNLGKSDLSCDEK